MSLIRALAWRQPYMSHACSGDPVSMTPDGFFAHIKADANSLVRRDCIIPFLGQFISFFVSRYSMMPAYPFYSDFIRSTYFL